MSLWQRRGDDDGATAPPARVEIYTWRFCPFCIRARHVLRAHGAAYREYRIDGDEPARARMAERAGGHWTVPQVFINDRHVGGCDELVALARSGGLDARLREPPADSTPD